MRGLHRLGDDTRGASSVGKGPRSREIVASVEAPLREVFKQADRTADPLEQFRRSDAGTAASPACDASRF